MSSGIDTKESVFSVLITFKGQTIALQNTMIRELYFIEDIFSPSIVGKLHIVDKFGIKDQHLLTGGEIITLVYRLWWTGEASFLYIQNKFNKEQ